MLIAAFNHSLAAICFFHNLQLLHYGPEAQIVNCPNIAYRPFKDETIEDDIPYRNTTVFESEAPLIDHICQMSPHLHNAEARQARNLMRKAVVWEMIGRLRM